MSVWDGTAKPLVYDAAGVMPAPKIWIGTATTNAYGQWTVDYSAAGFTGTPVVNATCIGPGTAAADIRNADVVTRTATGATGKAVVPAVSVLGLITVGLAGAGLTVMVQAIGR